MSDKTDKFDRGQRAERVVRNVLAPVLALLGYWIGDELGALLGGSAGVVTSLVMLIARRVTRRRVLLTVLASATAALILVVFVEAISDPERPPPPMKPPPPAKANPVSAKVDLRVLKWCYCDIHGQEAQIKVKVAVENRSGRAVDISAGQRSRIVLAIPANTPKRWRSAYRPPYHRSGSWLLIPPNPPEQQVVPLDFVTHWTGKRLASGALYVRQQRKEGDLVFSVSQRLGRIPPEIRLAYAEPGALPYFSPPGTLRYWPDNPSDPRSF